MENITYGSLENKNSFFKVLGNFRTKLKISKRGFIVLTVFITAIIISNLLLLQKSENRFEERYRERIKADEERLYYGSGNPTLTPTPIPNPPLIKNLGNGFTYYKSYAGKFSFVLPSSFTIETKIDSSSRNLIYIKSPNEEYIFNSGGGSPGIPDEKYYRVEIVNGKAWPILLPHGPSDAGSPWRETLKYGPFQLIKPTTPSQTFMGILYSYRNWNRNIGFQESDSELIFSEILNDLSFEFKQYTAFNVNLYQTANNPKSVDAKIAIGTAGYKNSSGGIFFVAYKNTKNSDWVILWKAAELHDCLRSKYIPAAWGINIECDFAPDLKF